MNRAIVLFDPSKNNKSATLSKGKKNPSKF